MRNGGEEKRKPEREGGRSKEINRNRYRNKDSNRDRETETQRPKERKDKSKERLADREGKGKEEGRENRWRTMSSFWYHTKNGRKMKLSPAQS